MPLLAIAFHRSTWTTGLVVPMNLTNVSKVFVLPRGLVICTNCTAPALMKCRVLFG